MTEDTDANSCSQQQIQMNNLTIELTKSTNFSDYADCLLAGSGWNILNPTASCQHNLYDVYLLLCVQCLTPEDGQRYCPKHVQSYSKNQFENIMLLVSFIIRIYHEAWSSECPKNEYICYIKYHMTTKHSTNTSCTLNYILRHKYSNTNQTRYFISQAIPQD